MNFPNIFKLEKLKIQSFQDRARTREVPPAFEAMFNPTSIKTTHRIRYVQNDDVAGISHTARFSMVLPAKLEVELLFDGNGVNQMGVVNVFGGVKSVSERIEDFMQHCYKVSDSSHEPRFLIVGWGGFNRQLNGADGLRCRLESAEITYTSFERDASPLRALLKASFTADDELERQRSLQNLSSPDVTHSRVVRNGDTLPLMTREVYGTSRHHWEVARANGLNTLRELTPGRELVFPPIAK
jgi:hypothetical protein